MDYYNWQQAGTPGAYDKTKPYCYASPNLTTLENYCLAQFGGSNLGTYDRRLQSSGSGKWSSHASGAAWDYGYSDRAMILRVIDFLIEHHVVLGVQMIIDENHDRTWLCERVGGPGWKSGSGRHGNWIHVETTKDAWLLNTSITSRLATPPTPTPPTQEAITMIALDHNPDTPTWTAYCWTGVELAHTFDGNADQILRRAGVPRQTVNDAELLGIIKSSKTTNAPPSTLTPAMKLAWG